MRFVNETSSVLPIPPLGIEVSPNEEFDWPAWSATEHGPITGCRVLDAPVPAGDGEDTQDPAAEPAATTPARIAATPAPTTTPAAAGSEEK